jgi:hypothetical protein
LLEQVENEDELAFVLGHEVAHAIYRHEAKNWAKKSQYYAVVSGSASDAVAQSSVMTAAGLANPYLGGALSLAVHLQKLSNNVLMPQMERGQEDAADALGFDLMVRAGYDPEAALAVMDKLAEQEAEAARAAAEAKAAAKTTDRANSMSGVNIGMQVLGVVMSGGTNPLAWSNLAITAFGAAVDNMAADATSHHPAREREDLLSAYAYREYRTAVYVNPTPLPWSPVSASPIRPQLTALLAHYSTAEDAAAYVADRTQGTDAAARMSIATATGAPTADHAYTEFVAAEYYKLGQQDALSEAALLRAVTTLVVALSARRAVFRAVFNVAQLTLSLAAAAAVLPHPQGGHEAGAAPFPTVNAPGQLAIVVADDVGDLVPLRDPGRSDVETLDVLFEHLADRGVITALDGVHGPHGNTPIAPGSVAIVAVPYDRHRPHRNVSEPAGRRRGGRPAAREPDQVCGHRPTGDVVGPGSLHGRAAAVHAHRGSRRRGTCARIAWRLNPLGADGGAGRRRRPLPSRS